MRLQWFVLLLLAACTTPKKYAPGTFGYDEAFLKSQDSNLVVLRDGSAEVIVSPKYQGKVFTSTVDGKDGRSLGWVHYKSFAGPEDPHMNAYGGENRLWLGPEGGRFSLFFHRGDSMTFAHWKTPPAFDTEPWEVVKTEMDKSILLQKKMNLTNYAGVTFHLLIMRGISLLREKDVKSLLGVQLDPDVKFVGYANSNILYNKDSIAWKETTGTPCLWVLDMFPPSALTTIVIPYNTVANKKPATTDYFGEIPPNRIKFTDSVLYFLADGKSRGKLGIHPDCVEGKMGSYDALNHILTITMFDYNDGGQYLNQEWNTIKPPYSGDAANAYNDGPLAGGGQLGPFYELESVSPAEFLGPGAYSGHMHLVFHFSGPEASLDKVAKKVLGASLEQIQTAFTP